MLAPRLQIENSPLSGISMSADESAGSKTKLIKKGHTTASGLYTLI
jgi:hypothetical protein